MFNCYRLEIQRYLGKLALAGQILRSRAVAAGLGAEHIRVLGAACWRVVRSMWTSRQQMPIPAVAAAYNHLDVESAVDELRSEVDNPGNPENRPNIFDCDTNYEHVCGSACSERCVVPAVHGVPDAPSLLQDLAERQAGFRLAADVILAIREGHPLFVRDLPVPSVAPRPLSAPVSSAPGGSPASEAAPKKRMLSGAVKEPAVKRQVDSAARDLAYQPGGVASTPSVAPLPESSLAVGMEPLSGGASMQVCRVR